MSILIKNVETDALVRRLAKLKGVGLTEAVHLALQRELEAMDARPTLAERSETFVRRLHERANPSMAKPVDKAFIDSLYEDD